MTKLQIIKLRKFWISLVVGSFLSIVSLIFILLLPRLMQDFNCALPSGDNLPSEVKVTILINFPILSFSLILIGILLFLYGMVKGTIKALKGKERLIIFRGVSLILFAPLFMVVVFLLDLPSSCYVLWGKASFICFIGATISLLFGSILLIIGIIRRERHWKRVFLVGGGLLYVVSLIWAFLFSKTTGSVTCYEPMNYSQREPPAGIEEKRDRLLNKFQREGTITEKVLKKLKEKGK